MKDVEDQVARMPIPLPYNLRHDELVVTKADVTYAEPTAGEFRELMHRTYTGTSDDAIERILRGTVCLMNRPDNRDPLNTCLHQAMVWEFG